MQPNVTVWDGEWIRGMTAEDALVAQAAGTVQIFDGPNGYVPGFMMAYPQEFPLAPFDGSTVFEPGDVGGVFDISRMDLCYQDDAGTIPVTALGQDVLSIRATNNAGMLIVFNDTYNPTPCVYAQDANGKFCLTDADGTGTQWVVYGIESAGGPTSVEAYTCVSAGKGIYNQATSTLGCGSTVIGDTDGTKTPYAYSGVYANHIAGTNYNVFGDVRIDEVPNLDSWNGSSLDGVPFIYTVRGGNNYQTSQINNAPVVTFNNPQPMFDAPVGMRIWIGVEGSWYGSVLIGKLLSDPQVAEAKFLLATLSGAPF